MRVKLVLENLFANGPFALAWVEIGENDAVVHVRKPFHLVFFALERLVHELWHVKEPTAEHDNWSTFGIRVGHALRFQHDAPAGWFEEARTLRRFGMVEW